ncbi:MAG: signal transduction histidine kinase [Bacteroidetes bacterium]|nr:MAG: signal transduction histidine kinase [Bacteroidota bacterium]
MKFLHTIEKLISKYQLFIVEDDSLRDVLLLRNITRIRIASYFIIVLTFIHVVVFFVSGKQNTNDVVGWWTIGIIINHSFLLLIYLFILLYLRRFKEITPSNRRKYNSAVIVAFLSLLFGTTSIALVDQLVTPAINPFIIGSVAVALVVSIPPLQALLALAINLFIFLVISPLIQDNETVVISNNVNAVTAVFLAFFIFYTLWMEFIKRRNQNLVVEIQQQELKKGNELLSIKAAELKASDAQKSKLFSIIAHDLRGPFNALIGSSELLLNEDLALTDEDLHLLKTNVLKTAQSSYFLLENLLSWAQLQQNKMTVNPIPINLTNLIKTTLTESKSIANAKKIQFQFDYKSDLNITGDLFMLQTVFRNLLMNAIKFSHPSGIITVELDKLGKDFISIRFIDNGLGMDESTVNSLFTDNVQKISGTGGETGIGLGLLLVNEFVDLHKGTIHVSSKIGKGTTFEILLPSESNLFAESIEMNPN